jgi:ribonuclease HII
MNLLTRSVTLFSLLPSKTSAFTPYHFQQKKSSSLLTRMPRRSARIRALHSASSDDKEHLAETENPKVKRARTVKAAGKAKKKKQKSGTIYSLPRDLEFNAYESKAIEHVMGIDEAGRGPLAGPVVAAAVIFPKDSESLSGIVDSKKITKEEDRESLYGQLIKVPNIRWAVCVVDAKRIDEINILQATLEAMRSTAMALINPEQLAMRLVPEASIEEEGCYVVTSESKAIKKKCDGKTDGKAYYSLIDGNKIPKDMPCDADCIVKGDGKEFTIAAASILAKVTRDRLMHAYHDVYPQFEFARHKGYPTKAHVAAINAHGAAPIHRLTFAPLKNMGLESKPTSKTKKKKA